MKDLSPARESLEPIETASRDEISALQLERLRWSLNHAYSNVAHYKKSFDEAGVHPDDLKHLEDLGKFPFTVKQDLRENYPFGMFAVPREQVSRIHASSGTTGKPTVVGYTEKDIDNARKFALEKLANELLGVRDSMEMGLSAAQEEGTDIAKLVEGSELTLKMLATLMDKFNIVAIDPVGEKFNPDHHQAISMVPSPEHDNNIVMSVMQKGYLLNDRLLRPAMVIVSKN